MRAMHVVLTLADPLVPIAFSSVVLAPSPGLLANRRLWLNLLVTLNILLFPKQHVNVNGSACSQLPLAYHKPNQLLCSLTTMLL
jgi:hypothetical protein